MSLKHLEITSSIDIAAPPERVWSTLVDADRWPTWCSVVRTVHEVPERWEPGARLSYTLGMGPGVPVRFDVTLDAVEPGRLLAWSSSKWWGVRGDRAFRLTPIREGTRVTDTKAFSSRLWPIGAVYPRGSVRRMSERWLADLGRAVTGSV